MAVYDERICEPGLRTARRLFAGLAIGIGSLTLAVGVKIASGDERPSPPTPIDETAPEQAVLSANVIRGFVYNDLLLKAEYAQERVDFDGRQETVDACLNAVNDLAKVTLGPVEFIDCTP